MIVRFHPDAIQEGRDAFRIYQERDPDVARRFWQELGRVTRTVQTRPMAYPKYLRGTRRALLQRFPLGLVYRVAGGEILVLAIAHSRRKPGYWRARH